MTLIRLGLVGVGKIARDRHLPAIAADPRFQLVATNDPYAPSLDIPNFTTIEEMIAQKALDAVAFCTPPGIRHDLVVRAIDAGLHVMLEKPPTVTLGDIDDLTARARGAAVALFGSWHSREAAGVEPARAWLAGRRIRAATITWKEDIRLWHWGQDWILDAGGFGAFDPGINALSIASAILPAPLRVTAAVLWVPEGRHAPIAAQLSMRSGQAAVAADFDCLQTGPQTWDIAVDTDAGTLLLSDGGACLALPGQQAEIGPDREYPRLYDRFAELIAARTIDVDVTPLRLVADAMLTAERRPAPQFRF